MRTEFGAEEIQRELELAERARREGREGRARVCARRAAGWSIGPFYQRSTGSPPSRSAIQLLRWYHENPEAPAELRAAAERLTTPVGEDHRHPYPEDPLQDARTLVVHLMGPTDWHTPEGPAERR